MALVRVFIYLKKKKRKKNYIYEKSQCQAFRNCPISRRRLDGLLSSPMMELAPTCPILQRLQKSRRWCVEQEQDFFFLSYSPKTDRDHVYPAPPVGRQLPIQCV